MDPEETKAPEKATEGTEKTEKKEISKETEPKKIKPLNILIMTFGAIILMSGLLIWLMPSTKTICIFGAVIITLIIWKWFVKEVKALWKIELTKKIVKTIFLGGLYLFYFYVSYKWTVPKLVESIGFSYHHVLVIFTGLQLPVIGAIYYLFSTIWPERGKIFKGFLIISIVGPLVIAYIVYMNPYWYFDHQTGKNRIWVSVDGERFYHSPGYDTEDGQALRPATAKDAERLKNRKENFKDKVDKKFEEWSGKEVQSGQVRRLSGTFKVPARKLIHTGIVITKNDIRQGAILRLSQNKPETFWFINGDGPNIKIRQKTWLIKLTSPGEVQLKGGTRLTQVKTQIIF